MKELSIEQKAHRYDEAIEQLRTMMPNWESLSYNGKTFLQDLVHIIPELKESEDERIRKGIIRNLEYLMDRAEGFVKDELKERIAWLEKQGKQSLDNISREVIKNKEAAIAFLKSTGIMNENGELSKEYRIEQGEQKPAMIQWNGNNLKEVIDFTGFYKEGFEKWFHNSWEEYVKYVHEHNNIFKIFNEDGSHIEVPVGAWIVKTPDGYNTASRYVFRQKPAWSEEDKDMLYKAKAVINRLCAEGKEYVWSIKTLKKIFYWLNSLKDRLQVQPQNKWISVDKEVYVKEPILAQKKDKSDPFGGFVVCCDHTLTPNVYERYMILGNIVSQNTWKPSDEQIRPLEYAIDYFKKKKNDTTYLESLYQDLKKLREE